MYWKNYAVTLLQLVLFFTLILIATFDIIGIIIPLLAATLLIE